MEKANITERVVIIRLTLIEENLSPKKLKENSARWKDIQNKITTPNELYDITRGI